MRHIINMGSQRYTFMKRTDQQPGDRPMVFNQGTARQVIDPMMRNPMANRGLRNLLKEVSAFSILSKLGDTEVSAQLVKRLVSGEIKVVAVGPGMTAGAKKTTPSPGKKSQPAPKVAAVTTQDPIHWIKFKVIDDQNQPIKGVKMNLTFTGKKPKSHALKGAFLHLKDLESGTCDINAVDCDDIYEVVEFKG
jgi:hypothetical protein